MEHFNEAIDWLDEGMSFDAESNIYRNIKILGFTSVNKRRYTSEAMKEAIANKIYENRPVYIDHKNDQRSYSERAATILNPKFDEAKGMLGDLSLNPKHPASEQIKWDLDHKTPGVGMSQSAFCESRMEKDISVITKINKIKSIDIVAEPATCSSFYESTETKEFNEVQEQINEIQNQLNEIKNQLSSLNNNSVINPGPKIELDDTRKTSVEDFLKRITKRY